MPSTRVKRLTINRQRSHDANANANDPNNPVVKTAKLSSSQKINGVRGRRDGVVKGSYFVRVEDREELLKQSTITIFVTRVVRHKPRPHLTGPDSRTKSGTKRPNGLTAWALSRAVLGAAGGGGPAVDTSMLFVCEMRRGSVPVRICRFFKTAAAAAPPALCVDRSWAKRM
jgi:hypothetical protein